MKLAKKILFIWVALHLLYAVALLFLPHTDIPIPSLISRTTQSLLLVISIFISMREPSRKNKFIFLNLACFFVVLVLCYADDFISAQNYSRYLFDQYVSIASTWFSSLSVVYLVIDLLFRNFKIYQKYLSSLAIVFAFFLYYFHPYIQNSLYLYSTEEIKQWKTISQALPANGEIPTAAELARKVKLQTWRDGVPVGPLYPEANFKRIEELTPYLEGDNWRILLLKPLYLNIIQMNVLIIGFVLLFFGYQYKKDPPQGAYIDKIMFLFLLYSSMEIVHYWGFIKSAEATALSEIFNVGQYVTLIVEFAMIVFFSLRLKFITSVQGEFYETELATNPQQVSRWRDWVDNIVLQQFFSFKVFNGRLFQNPDSK